jgi:hypothetical protein
MNTSNQFKKIKFDLITQFQTGDEEGNDLKVYKRQKKPSKDT